MKMLKTLMLLMLFAPAAYPAAYPAAKAQSISCDTDYIVQRGDWLSKIAERAYGDTFAYQSIIDFNRGKITQPSKLYIGTSLYIPCENGEGRYDSILPDIPPLNSDKVKIVTGSNYPPYVGDNLPEGGYSSELVKRAMLSGGGTADFSIDVVSTWESQLDPMLSRGAYQLAYPWFKPDCGRINRLGDSSRWRCENLLFSDALHEVAVKFYTNQRKTNIRSQNDLRGLRICRPSGYFTHDLEVIGLTPKTYKRFAPETPTNCFEMLMANKADVVTLNADTAENVIETLGVRSKVTELIDLTTIQTLHVVAAKNRKGSKHIQRFNRGLKTITNNNIRKNVTNRHRQFL